MSLTLSDSKGLSNPGEVEALREKVYASLEAYCKQKYPEQPGRYSIARYRSKPLTRSSSVNLAEDEDAFLQVPYYYICSFTSEKVNLTAVAYKFSNDLRFQTNDCPGSAHNRTLCKTGPAYFKHQ